MPPSTSIRKLIEQALEEAREEFAEIVKRKVEALMGDGQVAPRRTPASKPARATRQEARQGRRPAPATPERSAGGRRSRAPEAHMAELRSRVLAAMPIGEPLKRARIIELARVSDDDEPRVAAVLRKLKDEGILQMRGTKASAVYTRKG